MTLPRFALVALAAGCTNSAGGGRNTPSPGAPTAVEVGDATAFWLPINSERFGVSGRASQGVCVGLVWDFSNLGKDRTEHCDDFDEGFPYVVVMQKSGECDDVWDYHRNAVLVSATGCIEPNFDGASMHSADVRATISSGLFAGEIHVVVQ